MIINDSIAPKALYVSHVLIEKLLPELLGKPDEHSFGPPNVAEPIHVFLLDQEPAAVIVMDDARKFACLVSGKYPPAATGMRSLARPEYPHCRP